MINNFIKKLAPSVGIGVICILLCFSCDTELRETYEQYIPEDVVSIAKPDSVAIESSGFNKILFKVFVNSDPKVKKAVISLFDDDLTDDDDKLVASIDINRTVYQAEIYEVEVQLPEGGSEYFIHLEDAYGNKSVSYDAFGTVYGDNYVKDLLPREYSTISQYSESEAIIYWKSNRDNNNEIVDDLLVETEITYTSDADGSEKVIVTDESEDFSIIPDFVSEGMFTYTTSYKFSSTSDVVFESEPAEGTFPAKI